MKLDNELSADDVVTMGENVAGHVQSLFRREYLFTKDQASYVAMRVEKELLKVLCEMGGIE